MLAASIPELLPEPWAASATASYIRAIPTTTSDTTAASLALGFPPETFVNINSGGTGPDGRDFNGILNLLSAINQWFQAGGLAVYNSTFSTAIGGYPNGAVLVKAAGTGFWISTVDNNTSDPDTGGANWDTLAGGNPSIPTYVSSAHAIGNAIAFAHGLGRNPTVFGVLFVNVTPELGYSAGDTLTVFQSASNEFGANTSIAADATSITFLYENTTGFTLQNKSTGVPASATVAKWNIIAWAY